MWPRLCFCLVMLVAGCATQSLIDLRTGCNAFVPENSIPSSDTADVLCGPTWLLQFLQNVNQTGFQTYLNRTNNNLARILDVVCPLPGFCETCAGAMASFYDQFDDGCGPWTWTSAQRQSAYNVGRACMTTNNPFQVFHPLPAITSNCYLCTRAFLVQQACTNTKCNADYGLTWFPMYPPPPNSDFQSGLASIQDQIKSKNKNATIIDPAGQVASQWGPVTVCRCFELLNSVDLLRPITAQQLNQMGYCLWVVYQGEPLWLETINGTVPITE